MKKYFFVLNFAFVLFLQGCGGQLVYNVTAPKVERKVTISQMEAAIMKATQFYQWEVQKVSDGNLIAKHGNHDVMAEVTITYSASSYTITYKDSQNFKYDGSKIHTRYNSWIHNLENAINANISATTMGTKVDTNSTMSITPAVVSSGGLTCEDTYSMTGTLMSGRVFTAKRTIDNINKEEAVAQAAAALTTGGYLINSTSPEIGMISASQGVGSHGKVIPVNIMFTTQNKGVIGTITVSTPSGVTSNAGLMKSGMCSDLLDTIHSTK